MRLDVNTKIESYNTERYIISQIKDLVNYKNLEPGDKLPSERLLAEKFETTRSNVRSAIQKLEFYGILKTLPQSGTFIANIGVTAMNGMITDILGLAEPDFKSLVETRILLELKTSRLAALRRTEEDLVTIKSALDAYSHKVINGENATQEDLLFHLAIAKASKNSMMNTFMLTITPEIITNFDKYHVCDAGMAQRGIDEHRHIFEAIENQDPQLAKARMKDHFKALYQYCYNI